MSHARSHFGCGRLRDGSGQLVVAGGSSDLDDLASVAHTRLGYDARGRPPLAPSPPSAALSPEGPTLSAGRAQAELYDPVCDSWSALPELQTKRSYETSGCVRIGARFRMWSYGLSTFWTMEHIAIQPSGSEPRLKRRFSRTVASLHVAPTVT
jgi:hypothetical protein